MSLVLCLDGPLNGEYVPEAMAEENDYRPDRWPVVDGGPQDGEVVWTHDDVPIALMPNLAPDLHKVREAYWENFEEAA